ncbi:MAG: hypothetical protein HYV97_09335 [Bdellovibrio sp.]|nr:hypothetical protein [Bdellovibrio sp.]
MSTNLRRLSLVFILLTSLFMILGGTNAHAKSYRKPLDQVEVPLIHHDKLLKRNDAKVIILRCADRDNAQSSLLSSCPVFQVIERSDANAKKTEIVLGQFEKVYFADFLAHLGGAYNPKYRVGPLAILTLYGFLGGGFYGGLPGAIAGGVVGFTLDLAKFPLALVYTLSSYGHRQIQQERLLVRLNDLQFNRTYRPTRILSRKHFMQIVNSITEYLDHFRVYE